MTYLIFELNFRNCLKMFINENIFHILGRIGRFLPGLALVALTACAPRTVVFTRSQLLMGHVPVNVSIRIPRSEWNRALAGTEAAYAEARNLEAKISEYQPESEISCLNRNAGKAFCPVSPATRELLQTSLRLSERTDHAFDIRFASLSPSGRQSPIALRQDATAKLGHRETRIGVGAIGKGFIVDRMIAILHAAGFANVLIDAGGDLRATGGPWRVAIQVPGAPPGAIAREAEIHDQAWATSGLYEQGRHIVDPRTLQKIDRAGSVTVKARDLTTADALATAFFVLGKEQAEKYQKRFPGIEVIWLEP
jgi:thiamine biosynthesis lipoprotein